MLFSVDRTPKDGGCDISHRGIMDDDLYDDREACVGSLVNRPCFPMEMPIRRDTSEMYGEFHYAWKQVEEDPLALAEKFSFLTNEYIEALPRPDRRSALSFKSNHKFSLFDAISLERSTWRLLHALYSDRLCHANSSLNKEPLKVLCYHSERDIVNNLYDTDADLRETQVVVDWLEGEVREEIVKVAERHECLFNEIAVWENTLHLLETLNESELKSKHLVTQLFPDATLVSGDNLAQKDVSDEHRYLHYLFLCVRGGDLQRAQRLCVQRGDITRAVAMEGWRPFHSSNLSEDSVEPTNRVEGNSTRVLSKCVAWWNSENPALNPYERAMFAAQSGNLSALLRAMTSGSWEDLLWAHCRALVESRVDATLRTKIDCGPRADTLSVLGRSQKDFETEDIGLQLPNSAWLPGSWTLSEAFSKAETVLGWCPINYLFRVVEEGSSFDAPTFRPSEISTFLNRNEINDTKSLCGSDSPPSRHMLLQALFYAICRGVALREYSELLTAVASVAPLFIPAPIREILASGVTNANWPDQLALDEVDCQVLRFLAHFVLCLRLLETGLPDEPCNAVFEVYIITLILGRRYSLVASYVAQLTSPVRQTRWYASFLASLKKPEDCRQCLEYADAAGLNVQSITRAVIRIVRRRFDEQESLEDCVLNASAPLSTSNGITDIVGGDVVAYLTKVDKARIAALDWLAHDRAQRGELLVLANSLIRLFIAMRKLGAARALLDRLPMALLDQLKLKLLQAEEDFNLGVARAAIPPWLSNTVREHEALILYLQAREAFDQWYVRIHSEKPTPPTPRTSAGILCSLAERVADEEAEKNFQARLECWNHEIELSTLSLIKHLESLLTYESPGWLVDAAVPYSYATTSTEIDVTGMVDSAVVVAGEDAEEDEEEEGGGLGIAGLGDSPHSRKLQMIILRETCLREVVFMLIKVFKLTGRHAECVRLADLVADSQLEIFKLFNECQMQTLLEQLQESMLHMQETCGDALGYSTN